mmetsp:Transcript_101834/g.296930  ORF Transcript_101834/g.296930 Transcript_101834/m.296930 type:complete len:464 (+) Transcript_101834:181-1572(+)
MLSFMGPEERRRDPEDGQWRTFKELQRECRGKYSEQEVRAYWERQCARQEDMDGDTVMHNVVNDPFMTAAVQPGEQPGRSPQPGQSQQLGQSQDRFMMQGANAGRRPSGRPPNAGNAINTGSSDGQMEGRMSSRKEELYEEMAKARRHWTEVACRLLGPGDLDRKASVRNILILAPWLVFMWVLLVWVLLRHYSTDTSAVLTALLAIAAAAMILLWMMGKRWGPVSLLVLGMLSLLAVCSGTVVGALGWHTYWRQYWWLQTGTRTEGNTAATSAAGLIDSAIIGFWDDGAKRTIQGTYVDNFRSAGYKDDHFYCVAPILSPETADGTFARVNFWAVGIDCCQLTGSFYCDDSRKASAGYGVVMLDEGFPCPDCHEHKFRAAIQKAEALHGLVSVPNAVLVRWVQNPMATEFGMLWKAVLFIITSGIFAFLVFGLLGWIMWYYGIGKRAIFEGSDDGARQKLLA